MFAIEDMICREVDSYKNFMVIPYLQSSLRELRDWVWQFSGTLEYYWEQSIFTYTIM